MSYRKNGVLLLLLGNIFFALIPITVRLAGKLSYSPAQTALFRFVFAAFGIFLLLKLSHTKIKIINFKAVFWRGLFGGLSVVLYFLALHFTTAAKGTLLNYTYSIWANLFAVIFLGQKPPKGFVYLLLLAVCGVWLVLDVRFGSFNWGDLVGVLSGATAGGATLAVKEARRTDNSLSVFASFTFFGLLISGALVGIGSWAVPTASPLLGWSGLTSMGWVVLLAMGATSMIAQLFFTEGFGYASLAAGTLLSLLVPVLAGTLGLFILKEPFSPHFLLGSFLVLTACGLFGWQESRSLKS